jgi:biotin transport system substrate-specific component
MTKQKASNYLDTTDPFYELTQDGICSNLVILYENYAEEDDMNKALNYSYNSDIISNKAAVYAIGVIFFVLATALGAYVRIPVTGSPVPITLQTFFVMLSGAVLGRRLGSFSQFCYLVLGAAGLPIFQGYSFGASYLLGPTGGYIVGFLFAAYLIGRMTKTPDRGSAFVIASFTAASLVIYAFGISWLIFLYRISIRKAFSVGVLPFITGDILKVLFAAFIYSKISRRVKAVFSE